MWVTNTSSVCRPVTESANSIFLIWKIAPGKVEPSVSQAKGLRVWVGQSSVVEPGYLIGEEEGIPGKEAQQTP